MIFLQLDATENEAGEVMSKELSNEEIVATLKTNNPPPKILGTGDFQICFRSGLLVEIKDASMTRRVEFQNTYYEFRRNGSLISTLLRDDRIDAVLKLP
jgi:hypothetical protein